MVTVFTGGAVGCAPPPLLDLFLILKLIDHFPLMPSIQANYKLHKSSVNIINLSIQPGYPPEPNLC